MKKLLPLILIAGTLITGCAGFKQNVLTGTDFSNVTAQIAMDVFEGFVTRGKIKPADVEKVRNIFEKYQASVRLVRMVANSTTEGQGSNAFEVALKALQENRKELIDLIFTLTK